MSEQNYHKEWCESDESDTVGYYDWLEIKLESKETEIQILKDYINDVFDSSSSMIKICQGCQGTELKHGFFNGKEHITIINMSWEKYKDKFETLLSPQKTDSKTEDKK